MKTRGGSGDIPGDGHGWKEMSNTTGSARPSLGPISSAHGRRTQYSLARSRYGHWAARALSFGYEHTAESRDGKTERGNGNREKRNAICGER